MDKPVRKIRIIAEGDATKPNKKFKKRKSYWQEALDLRMKDAGYKDENDMVRQLNKQMKKGL